MFSQLIKNSSLRQYFLFSLVVGLFVSTYLVQFHMLTQETTREKTGVSWVQPEETSKNAYFRYELPLDFTPKRAWVSIASNDYTLYINNNKAARNNFSANAGNAFDHFMQDKSQNLNVDIIQLARAPNQHRSANKEWRHLHYLDVSRFLKKGLNVFSVSIQSPDNARFYIDGMVYGDGFNKPIGVDGWKYSLLSKTVNHSLWIENAYDDSEWKLSQVSKDNNDVLFATINKDVFISEFNPPAIISDIANDVYYLSLDLDEYIHYNRGESAWIRIHSNWSYTLFFDDDVVGAGKNDGSLEGYDVSAYIKAGYSKINVRLSRLKNSLNEPPVFALDGNIGGQRISSGDSWKIIEQDTPGWLEGKGNWHKAKSEVYPYHIKNYRVLKPDLTKMDVTGYFISNTFYVMAFVLFFCLMIKRIADKRLSYSDRQMHLIPYWFLSIPVLLISIVILLTVRLRESDVFLYMLNEQFLVYIALLGLSITAIASLNLTLMKARAIKFYNYIENNESLRPVILLLAIMLVGFFLRFYQIGFEDLQADENVSWDAARGITKTGIPEAVSGVFYTRSPLYHYLLALWISIVGDNVETARSLALIPGVLVIAAVYYLVVAITGRPLMGLLVALLVALDPWMIGVSRIIRFYQQLQFFSVLSMYYFLKGFIWRTGKRDQNIFFIMCTVAVVSQEVFVILFPGLCIAYFIYYRPFNWFKDSNIPIGFITVLGITLIDIGIFSIVCLTPHVGISTSSGSIMQLHLINLSGFFNTFFYGINRASLLYSLFFFIGIFYWLKKDNKAIVTMYIVVLCTVITSSVLVMQVTSRYLYGIYPFFVILSVLTLIAIVNDIADRIFVEHNVREHKKLWLSSISVILIVTALINQEIYKLPTGYTENRLIQHESGLRFIKDNIHENDKILSVHPMPAAIIFGGIDYYLRKN